MPTARLLALRLLPLVLLSAVGCQSYQKQWDAFPAQYGHVKGVVGRWQGSWKSYENGHSGALRCMITPTSDDDGRYLARYDAVYLKMMRFKHDVVLTPRVVGSRLVLEGSADLGRLAGGVYRYEADIEGDRISATYESKHDRGMYELQRLVE